MSQTKQEPTNPVLAQMTSEFTDGPLLEQPADSDHQQQAEPKKDEPAAKKFRREIDTGDGSGKQVFEADTQDELIDALTKAQENATKKIRQQTQQIKQHRQQRQAAPVIPASKPAEIKPLTPDEEFTLAQELSRNPSKAFKRLFEAQTGRKFEDFGSAMAKLDAFEAAQAATSAASDFLADHADDYAPTAANYRIIQDYLDEHNLPMTRENLEEAFEAQNESGLLKAPSSEVTPEKKNEPAPRIEAQHRSAPTSSGLSDSRSRREPERSEQSPAALSDEELWNLPLEQARDRIVRALRTPQTSGTR